MSVYLVGYAKRTLYSEQPTVLLARRHLKTIICTNFENLTSISNTQFLSFNGPSNCLYLFKSHRQTISWPGKGPSCHIKVTKMWFGTNIKYLSEPFFADFCCRKGISCFCINYTIFATNLCDTIFASSRPEVFCEKGVLENLAIFTGKHLRRNLFLKLQTSPGLQFF